MTQTEISKVDLIKSPKEAEHLRQKIESVILWLKKYPFENKVAEWT